MAKLSVSNKVEMSDAKLPRISLHYYPPAFAVGDRWFQCLQIVLLPSPRACVGSHSTRIEIILPSPKRILQYQQASLIIFHEPRVNPSK